MNLECRKSAFSLPAGSHYLNGAYMSPLPVRVEDAGIAAMRRKRVPSDIKAPDFFNDSARARQLFARLIGAAEADRVAIIPAVSYAISLIARNTTISAGQKIVVSAEQFPSNVYAWRALALRTGAAIDAVAAPSSDTRGEAWNEALLDAIDTTTGVVALPQVHWTDGTLFDLEAIGRKCREVGAAFVIDATQSVGAYPFDVQAIGPDAVVCAAYKWLLGPYGIGVAWFGSRYDDAEPLEESWMGRAGSEDFRRLVNYRDDYQPGAARFDVGERSNFILVPMLIEGIQLLLEWGPANIQAYCKALVADALDEARSLGFGIEDEKWRASHLFGLRAPESLDLEALQQTLADRGVSVSLRGSAMRVSPNVYNDAADVSALIDVLRSSVAGAVV